MEVSLVLLEVDMDWTAVNGIAAAASAIFTGAALVAVVLVVRQLNLQREQMRRDFESLYVQRYWQIEDRINEAGLLPSPKRIAVTRTWRLAYLRLCEDEVDMRSLGRVTDETWNYWSQGIDSALKDPELRALLAEHEVSLPSLTTFLKSRSTS